MSRARWKENIERGRPVIPLWSVSLLLSLLLWTAPASAGAPRSHPGPAAEGPNPEWVVLLHVHGALSHGWSAIESLQRAAAARGIDVVVVTEHLVADWEWAPPLLREVTGFKRSLPSLQRYGLERYFEQAEAADRAVPEVVLITGAEVAPYYRWTGYPLGGRLTMWDWQRNLIVLGLDPSSYRRLPVIGLRAGRGPGMRDLLWGGVVAGVLIGFLYYLNHLRVGRTLLFGATLAALAWMGPPHPRPFSPYAPEPGPGPWQSTVDRVQALGGLALWSLVQEGDDQRFRWGRIHTSPHPEMLLQVDNYHGFGVLYPAQPTLHEPGGVWDRAWEQYRTGQRSLPPWGWGEAALHYPEQMAIKEIDEVLTIVRAPSPGPEFILEALRLGRGYAVRGVAENGAGRLRLEFFDARHDARHASMGERLAVSGPYDVQAEVGFTTPGGPPIEVRLIRNGRVVAERSGLPPLRLSWSAEGLSGEAPTVLRLEATARGHWLVSNPILLEPVRSPDPSGRP